MKATNASAMKEKNKRLILKLICENSYSRADIAKITKLTKAAVTIITEDLIKDGMVIERKTDGNVPGRKPLLLEINPRFMMAVGLNITRNYAELGIADIMGNVICEKKFALKQKNIFFKEVESCILNMIDENNIPIENIYGIGVTSPGPVDVHNTTILNPPNFDEWHYENIGLRLKNIIGRKVYLENISGGLTLCEKYFGIAKDMDNFLVLIIDDGIGSGIMNGGKLLRSVSELGHTSIAYNGIPCECGNYGCIEKYASVSAILKNTNYASWKDVINRNDIRLIEQEAEYLSCAIVNATNLFSIENVILEGQINYKTDKLIQLIESKIKRNKIVSTTPKVLSGSEYKGVVCAAVSVFDNYFG